jgi:hypothetical protein
LAVESFSAVPAIHRPGGWGQVLQSHTRFFPLQLSQPSTHRRIVHAQMVGDLPQAIPILPVGERDRLPLALPEELRQRGSCRLPLRPRDFRCILGSFAHPLDQILTAEVYLPQERFPRAPAQAVSDKGPVPGLRFPPGLAKVPQDQVDR